MSAKKVKPTEAEIEILSVLWEIGPATVREVHSQLIKVREVGYTTVLKLMQIMTEKGFVVRDESQRSHVYRPKQKAETVKKSLLSDLITRVFSGSTSSLVMQAISSKKATPSQLAKMKELLDELEGE